MKKRKILFLSALVSVISTWALDLPEITVQPGVDAWGYVHDGTKPIEGVLVTDGYSFVATDGAGTWQLTTNSNADFVYVIIPSGYEIDDVTDGIIKHYHRIDRSTTLFRGDFRLNPIGDDTDFSFMVHADPQPNLVINSACFAEMGTAYVDMAEKAHAIKDSEGFMPPMLMLGDVTHEIGYEQYKATLKLKKFDVPLFSCPGNHDKKYVVNIKDACERYCATFGPRYYSFNRGKVHFLMLDNVAINTDGDYARGISSEQMAWIRKDLEFVEKGSTVVVRAHISFTKSAADRKAYKNLLELLGDYNTLLLTGHHHRCDNLGFYSPTVEERNHAALSGHIWRGPVCRDGSPKGYYIYHCDGNDISWKFVQTGRDPDKFMFRLYEPSWMEYMESPVVNGRRILVNVWDWDPAWKVTWSLNGKEQGDVERFESSVDPLAVFNYNTLENTKLHAVESGHMFYCDVPDEGGEVIVTVTDRFGRILSKSFDMEAGLERIVATGNGDCLRTDLFDMQGRHVMTVDGEPEADTLPLPAGVYVKQVRTTAGGMTVEKIVL